MTDTEELSTRPRRVPLIGSIAVGVLVVGGGAWALSASADASSTGGAGSTGAYASSSGSSGSSGSTSTQCGPAAGFHPGGPGGPGGFGGPGRFGGPGSDGYVSAVSATKLSIRDLFGGAHSYTVSAATTVHAGSSDSLSVSDLEVGEHVRVEISGSKATEVDVLAATIDGAVTSVSGSTVTVRDIQGFTRTVRLASDTTFTKDGTKATSSAVRTGAVLHAEGAVDSDGTTLDATSVAVRTSAASGRPSGTDHPTGCVPAGGHRPQRPGGGMPPQPPNGSHAPTPPSEAPSTGSTTS